MYIRPPIPQSPLISNYRKSYVTPKHNMLNYHVPAKSKKRKYSPNVLSNALQSYEPFISFDNIFFRPIFGPKFYWLLSCENFAFFRPSMA